MYGGGPREGNMSQTNVPIKGRELFGETSDIIFLGVYLYNVIPFITATALDGI